MGIWVKWLLVSLAAWFVSVVGFTLTAMALPGSPLVYVFGALFTLSILAALVFLGLLFKGIADEGH